MSFLVQAKADDKARQEFEHGLQRAWIDPTVIRSHAIAVGLALKALANLSYADTEAAAAASRALMQELSRPAELRTVQPPTAEGEAEAPPVAPRLDRNALTHAVRAALNRMAEVDNTISFYLGFLDDFAAAPSALALAASTRDDMHVTAEAAAPPSPTATHARYRHPVGHRPRVA